MWWKGTSQNAAWRESAKWPFLTLSSLWYIIRKHLPGKLIQKPSLLPKAERSCGKSNTHFRGFRPWMFEKNAWGQKASMEDVLPRFPVQPFVFYRFFLSTFMASHSNWKQQCSNKGSWDSFLDVITLGKITKGRLQLLCREQCFRFCRKMLPRKSIPTRSTSVVGRAAVVLTWPLVPVLLPYARMEKGQGKAGTLQMHQHLLSLCNHLFRLVNVILLINSGASSNQTLSFIFVCRSCMTGVILLPC